MKRVLLSVLAAWLILPLNYYAFSKEEEFLAGLQRTRELMELRRWDTAKMQLRLLMDEHRDQDYVRARRIEIEDCMKLCTFGEIYTPPDPDSQVSGKLVSFNPTTGRIFLKYSWDQMEDFELPKMEEGAVSILTPYIHPVVFAGPYTIEFKGDYYKCGADHPLLFYLGMVATSAYSVNFGYKSSRKATGYMVPVVKKYNPRKYGTGGWEVIKKEDKSPLERGEPFQLKVKVRETEIVAYNGTKVVIRARIPKSPFGQFGISRLPSMGDEIVMQGKVNPSWVQGRLDAHRQAELEKFKRDFVPSDYLPDWLLAEKDAREGEREKTTREDKPYPGRDYPRQYPHLDKLTKLYENDKFEAALEYLDRLPEEEMTEEARALYYAVLYRELESFGKALAYFGRVSELDPKYYSARIAHAELLGMSRQKEKAIEALRKIIEDFPEKEDPYEPLAVFLLMRGRPVEAKEVIDDALRKGISFDEMDNINRMLVKALTGPDWNKKYEFKSKNYHVISDIDRKVCRDASKNLEEAYKVYTRNLQEIDDLEAKKFCVYLFSGQEGYLAYCEDIRTRTVIHSAGVYLPALKQLLIWNLPDRKEMMRTVRHEGFHQYLDRLMDDPPLWFNEGLAGYYEIAERKYGRWKEGQVHPVYIQILKRNMISRTRGRGGRLVPLEKFLYQGESDFYQDPELSYAQSWGFIHFLLHGTDKNKRLFEALFEAFQNDEPARKVLEEIFGLMNLEGFQKDFENHLRLLAMEK